MFIWDFVASTILEQIMDWVYKQIVGFLANFFAEMGNMGAELFEMSWVQSIAPVFLVSCLDFVCGRLRGRLRGMRAGNTRPAGPTSKEPPCI